MSGDDIANDVQNLSLRGARRFLTLDAFPTEIQDLIFDYVVVNSTRGELKRFRQSNRYFRDRADVYLFNTLHVSASKLSFARVRNVSENDRLNVHVRELIFHRGTFSGHTMVKFGGGTHMQPREYDDFESHLVRNGEYQARIMQASKCYDAFLQEIEAEALFNREIAWRTIMRKYCARFSKLEKLTTLPDTYDLESTYLRSRCALTHQSATPNYFAPYEILESCGPQFKPRTLSLDGVNGEDFASIMTNNRGGPQAIHERFMELRSFRISFSETVSSLEIENTYEYFIPACVNLRDLSLDFTSFYSPKMLRDPDSFPQKLIKLVLQQDYPKLASLELVYALMTEHDLISFLDRHRSTLTTLKLHRWPMPVTERQPTGSTIRAFWKIGQLPMKDLRTVILTGEFSCRSDGEGWSTEAWSANQDPRYDYKQVYPVPLYIKLIKYLEGSRATGYGFPFPVFPGVMEDAKTGKALLALDRMPYELGYSDPTFTWWEDTTPNLR